MGSVHYISPEQARGGYSDERSDIYSLGITIYEMVTGHLPFEGENNVAIALMHIQGEMVSPREYYSDIPTSLEKIILKCTQKKPERRYLTANALIADLRRVQADPDIDVVVVPPVVNNSPTVEMTSDEMKAIKEGRQLNEEGISEHVEESRITGEAPIIPPSQFDSLFDDDEDDDDEYDEEDEIENNPEDDDDSEYDELDPKLKKIIMISSIAVVVIIAILVVLLITKIAGFNLFSGNKEKNKNTTTEMISTTEDELSEDGSTEIDVTTEETTYPMIDVEGLYKTAAEEELKKAGFTNYSFNETTDNDVQEGYVISQNIVKGTAITPDTEIIITVSTGKEMADVPSVIGYSDSQATTLLEEAGFVVSHGYEYSDDVEKDYVISQEPGADESVAKGSTVKIVVSNGKDVKKTTVPNLVGKSESKAEEALEKANLVGKVSYAYSDDVKEGKVISQDVDASSSVEENSTIGYVVSQGPETITYTARFTGSITNSGFDFDTFGNVKVTVTYTVGDATYTLYNGAAGTESFPLDIGSSANPIKNLSSNSGTFGVSIVDSDGIDVTSSFNTGGLSASFSQE
jgi:serine/threonine-protein kinase